MILISLLAALAASTPGQEETTAFVGARLIPISSPEIPSGTIVVRGGKIVAVGAPRRAETL
jgi:imidazolonepropionase-like amidohydrolase